MRGTRLYSLHCSTHKLHPDKSHRLVSVASFVRIEDVKRQSQRCQLHTRTMKRDRRAHCVRITKTTDQKRVERKISQIRRHRCLYMWRNYKTKERFEDGSTFSFIAIAVAAAIAVKTKTNKENKNLTLLRCRTENHSHGTDRESEPVSHITHSAHSLWRVRPMEIFHCIWAICLLYFL